jgi:hypothetical protein
MTALMVFAAPLPLAGVVGAADEGPFSGEIVCAMLPAYGRILFATRLVYRAC